jgi:hypothetical protein
MNVNVPTALMPMMKHRPKSGCFCVYRLINVMNGIERDPAFIGKEEPFGIFLNDNHD